MQKIKHYFDKANQATAFHVLDDKTCSDLDFNQIFKVLDHTVSPIGSQYLYYCLRVLHSDQDKLGIKETILKRFENSSSFLNTVQHGLSSLSDNAFFIASLFQSEHVKSPRAYKLMKIIPYVMALLIALVFFNPIFTLVLFPMFLLNVILHYWYKRVLMTYVGSIPELLKLLELAEVFYQDEQLCGIDRDVISSIKRIKTLRYEMSLFNVDNHLQGDMYMLVWAIYEFIKILFLLEPLALFKVLRSLEQKKDDIEVVYRYIGEIDVLQSVAVLRQAKKTCIPDLDFKNKGLKFDNAYHILIPDCVENSMDASAYSVLLTGSNMSGKTTFIKMIALNVVCGIALNTCFADYFTMPYLKLYSAIRISDDLLNDKSYYKEEVLRIGRMIEVSQQEAPCLFILDEIYKGTNTQERIAAGKAVLSYLLQPNNTIFVSTHDIELADLLEREFRQYHFTETVTDKEIAFDYKLKEGQLKNRNAIRILALNNYPPEIIDEANAIATSFIG